MTVGAYSSRAARFLARYAPDGDPAVIAPGNVTAAVLADASGLSAGAGQHLACALRAFLRYCHVRGLVAADVSAAALSVTGRRTTMLPRGLEPGQVEALLAACDRAGPHGRRDYAVILLLARLGLRAGEAARLRLDDVNWRAGETGIRGKGGQYDVLPLPADAGAAIAAWLHDGRPAVSFREVFTTVTAPTRPLTREAVGWIVRRACTRAGLEPFGPHRLRHNAACAMIGAKVPLAGIAQAMRHRSHGVTAIYARAGIDRLRPLARPWPGTPALPGGGSVMTTPLHERAQEYLRLRRALGFRLRHEGYILPRFAGYLEQRGAVTVTAEHAIAWAQLPQGVHPVTWTHRLSAVRGFAAWLRTVDPATEIPPRGVFPGQGRRPAPFIFASGDLAAVIAACAVLRPAMRAAACTALFGLIAVTGVRIGEALAIPAGGIDLDAGLLPVMPAKSRCQRILPLHPTTVAALADYDALRARELPRGRGVLRVREGNPAQPAARADIIPEGLRRGRDPRPAPAP